MLKVIIAFAMVLGFAGTSVAADGETTMRPTDTVWSTGPQISEGDYIVGGGFSWVRTGGTSVLTFTPTIQYFLWNNVAVGGTVTLTDTTTTTWGVGPTATWFFWTRENVAAHATTGVDYTNTTVGNTVNGRLGAGFDWFFSPTVSFGPELSITTNLSAPTGVTVASSTSFIGRFSIYL